MTTPSNPTNRVGIFRLQLHKPSEGFIYDQAASLGKYAPTIIGRKKFGSDPRYESLAADEDNRTFHRTIDTLQLILFRNPNLFLQSLAGKPLDILHAHFAIDAVYAVEVAKRLRLPLVTTLHGFDVTRNTLELLSSLRPALVNGVFFRNRLFTESGLFICVSKFIHEIARRKGFPEDKLRLHYIGIDTQKIAMRDGPGEDGLIVHVARLVEVKGTKYLLNAFPRILETHKNARLVIIGDGPLRRSLEALSMELGISNRVQFLGTQSNSVVLDWDRRASVKVVPSITTADGIQEGFGMVNLEAAALGVPVVAFDSGGIGEAVIHGETGMLAPERNVEQLAQHISSFLSSANLRERVGKAARDRAVADFDLRKQTQKLEEIYDEARG